MTDPIAATISGVPVVTIPAAEYAELLACWEQLARLRLFQEAFQPRSKASIDQDPEVAAFIASRLGKVFLREVLAECRERFGVSRTPSRSAAQRYWLRLRGLKR
ncbi:hypothetical protein [Blastochloris tepida]|uniref:Uncharacterized protein n=1 Tax=Blastochloris tepida TaxID=2233851 RepID=A0A348G020_9HYPH|nr:hypothetical protein [Blastochloris tepida]BBF92903.1 hypothetical protein BLTE_15880 [Blastochloris tepida]